MLVHRRDTPSIKFAGTHLNIRVERGNTVKVKCLAQEHKTIFPRSGLEPERTNHDHSTYHTLRTEGNFSHFLFFDE